jgi:methyl-accepting chemotaxis protein
MKGMKLKTKLVLMSLSMVILVMVVSTTAVSFLVNKQNRKASYDQLRKSGNVVRTELSSREETLLEDAGQIASFDKMGSKIKFLYDYKNHGDPSMTKTTFCQAATSIYNISVTGNLWGAGIYDNDGDLVAFAGRPDRKNAVLGYCIYSPQHTVQYGRVTEDGKVDLSNQLKQAQTLPFKVITAKLGQAVPNKQKLEFKDIGNYVCLVAAVPVMADVYDPKTQNLTPKQVGIALAVQKLGQGFVSRVSSLTGMKTNIFTSDGFSAGNAKFYTSLQGHIEKPAGAWSLQSQEIVLSDLTLNKRGFFQGALPLFDGSHLVGTVVSILSQEVMKAYTFQMIRLLALVFIACILVIVPIVFLFSNSLAKPIVAIIRSLTESAEKVSGASDQVSSSSQHLAQGSSEQTASFEETSASLEQISSMTKQNAENAQEANHLSAEGSDSLETANQSMKALIKSMDDISEASDSVSKIIKTIDEIAFQTNLLALNAAVEAARAGEAGTGFAVVADEVRNLALRSAEASKNTQDLVAEIIRKIEAGSDLVTETDDRYREVAICVGKIAELNRRISSASDEQATGIAQVSVAVNEMDSVTQQNAANAEESASASEELNAQAKQMTDIVKSLVSLVGANGSGRTGTTLHGETGKATKLQSGLDKTT